MTVAKVKLGKHIVKYTEEKLNYVLNQAERPPIFLEIFSPTCPACQSLAPRMSQAAAMLKDQAPEMKVIAVDGTQAENTMKDLGAAEFPALFVLSPNYKTYRLPLSMADSSAAIARWALRAAAPAVQRKAPDTAVDVPQLLLRAKDMVPAFESLAEERKMDFEAYWIPDGSDQAVSSIRHPGQPEVNFTWTHSTADSLDEEGERFEDFVKENSMPAVMLVKEPKKTMKMLEGHQDALLLWLVLNSAAKEAPCEETCSASGASAPQQAQALEDALKPWSQLLQETRQVYQASVAAETESSVRKRKKLLILAIDIHEFPSFVEHELYAWHAPALVAQRFRHGPRYFFSDVATMPESPESLVDFMKGLVNRSPRQMSERPQLEDSSKFWQKLVNVGLEERLRQNGATILYVYKSPDSISNDEEVIDFEDEMEALDAMSEWLNKSCNRPPIMAALDVRKNEVPLSLYAAASIGGLNAPSLYFIESDVGKTPVGIRWAGDVAEFQKSARTDPTSLMEAKRNSFLRGSLNQIIPWVLEQSRRKAFDVPAEYLPGEGLAFRQKTSAVLDLFNEKDLQKLLERKVSGFMEFYSPSCGACKKFAPSYESAARKAETFTLARMDCSTAEGERSCNKHGVDKYPTVLYMANGRLEKYPGGPGRDQLLEFLEAQSSPLVEEVKTLEVARALADTKPVLLWSGETFSEVLEVKVAKVAKALEEPENLRLIWPRSSGKSDVLYDQTGKFSKDELSLWLAEQLVRSAPIPAEQTSPVLTVVGANFRQVLYAPLARGQHVMLKVYAPWCGHCKKLAPIYEDFAQKMQDEGRDLVLAELDGEANGIPFDGFDYTGFPTIFYLSPKSAEIQKVQARSLDALQRFVQKMQIPSSKASQSKPSMESLLSQFRSEEPPSVQTSPVLTVVLRNFIEVVFHQRRHCILMLHDKKCPHCKQMMPQLDAFAKELSDDVFVAKMDGKLNDLPVSGFKVKGYPTLFFIEAGQKEPSFQQIGSNALHAMRRFMEGKGLLGRQVKAEL